MAVVVINKLGNKFGMREIWVNTMLNDQNTSSLPILPWEEKTVYPIDPQALQSEEAATLDLGALEIIAQGNGNGIPIPFSITVLSGSNFQYNIVKTADKWIITFDPPIAAAADGVFPAKNGESNVNVTIGEDEEVKTLVQVLAGFTAGLIVGLLLYVVSPILWGGAVLASLAATVVAWFKSAGRKRKKQEGESKEPIKKTIE